jgi:hypothetical protein
LRPTHTKRALAIGASLPFAPTYRLDRQAEEGRLSMAYNWVAFILLKGGSIPDEFKATLPAEFVPLDYDPSTIFQDSHYGLFLPLPSCRREGFSQEKGCQLEIPEVI